MNSRIISSSLTNISYYINMCTISIFNTSSCKCNYNIIIIITLTNISNYSNIMTSIETNPIISYCLTTLVALDNNLFRSLKNYSMFICTKTLIIRNYTIYTTKSINTISIFSANISSIYKITMSYNYFLRTKKLSVCISN